MLEKAGYYPAPLLVKPQKKYATVQLNEVLYTHPSNQLIGPAPKKGAVIKLFYVNETIRKLIINRLPKMAELKKEANHARFKENVQSLQDILPRRK
ncbi:hypothetical protein D3X11_03590 [Streptococcus sp. X16XC17]|uniref:hypothetical protein n=1 Tax=unclassified Streptococcus TaxID=2608887 RepID=UPI00066FC583|nr:MULTISPECIES: hypothetical protein [unclassified Streptococcus]TCD46489.1 hypothetical protein D3X11_03590 [Streptococcus sp. X16XC17]